MSMIPFQVGINGNMVDGHSLQGKLVIARNAEQMSLANLRTYIGKIGMVRSFTGEDESQLLNAIQRYVADAVRVEVLNVMSREDFYLAMAHSASKVSENTP